MTERYTYNINETNRIGSGGFTKVYKGYDRLLEQAIAIKIFPYSGVGYPFDTWKEEFKLISNIRHQNVVEYLDFIIFDNEQGGKCVGIIMEYCDFGTLKDIIYQGNYSDYDIIEIFKGILEGLKFVHERGIIHCDIKPSNIIIKKDSYTGKLIPKLSDFYYCRYPIEKQDNFSLVAINPCPTMTIGTIEYMAPEAYDSFLGPMTDLWSIGVMIYEFFMHKLPFKTRNEVSLFEVARNVISIEVSSKGIPAPFNEIINLCLVKDIRERVSDASVLLRILEIGKRKFNKKKPNPQNFELYKIELLSQIIDIDFVIELNKLKEELAQLKSQKAEVEMDGKSLLNLIKKNNIEDCFKQLNLIEKKFEKGQRKTLIILESQWTDIKQKERVGILNTEETYILNNKIKFNLLEFITDANL
jgi:serine/threonine protein kinase